MFQKLSCLCHVNLYALIIIEVVVVVVIVVLLDFAYYWTYCRNWKGYFPPFKMQDNII